MRLWGYNMAETRLSSESRIKALREVEAEIQRSRPTLTEQQLQAETFASELEQRIGQREISPEARSREKETISKLFGTPSAVRGELAEAGVRPGEASGIVAGRMNTYLDQLDSIRQSRKDRQTRIDDIVASAAEGVKSSTKRAELEFKALESKKDDLWREYKEAVRQTEKAQTNKILNDLLTNQKIAKNNMWQRFDALKKETEASAKADFGDDYLQHWDGGLDPNKWLDGLTEAERDDPVSGRETYITTFPAFQNINLESSYNVNVLKEGGLSDLEIAGNISKSALTNLLTAELVSIASDPEMGTEAFEDARNNAMALGLNILSEGAEGEKLRDSFKFYLEQKYPGMGTDLSRQLFPLNVMGGGSGVGTITNPKTGETTEVGKEE